jgi:hypothetical protein
VQAFERRLGLLVSAKAQVDIANHVVAQILADRHVLDLAELAELVVELSTTSRGTREERRDKQRRKHHSQNI